MQENPIHRYKNLWLFIGYALVSLVIYMSLSSNPDLPDLAYADKVGHFLAYFSMMLWFSQIYHIKKQRMIYAISFIVLGVALEFAQSFNPARMAEFADMVANASGVLVAILITRMTAFRLILMKVESYL